MLFLIRAQRSSHEYEKKESQLNVLLPKITMVGVSTGEAGQMNKAAMKKTMDDLTRELEESDQGSASSSNEHKLDDRDPLFVANVGAKWVRGESAKMRWGNQNFLARFCELTRRCKLVRNHVVQCYRRLSMTFYLFYTYVTLPDFFVYFRLCRGAILGDYLKCKCILSYLFLILQNNPIDIKSVCPIHNLTS